MLASDGRLFSWGSNQYGQLGDGTNTIRTTPVAVNMNGALAGKTIAAIAVEDYHCLALTSDGQVILSGILVEERSDMLAVLKPDWRVIAEEAEEKWWSVAIARA